MKLAGSTMNMMQAMPSILQPSALNNKVIDELKEMMVKVLTSQKFKWDMPTSLEMREDREQYRSRDLAQDFLEEHDLFGENKIFKPKAEESDIQIRENGQVNLKTTKSQSPGKDAKAPTLFDELDAMQAKLQADMGDKADRMNFTPMLAHRYVQQQMNEFYRQFKEEKDLQEKFRGEFE